MATLYASRYNVAMTPEEIAEAVARLDSIEAGTEGEEAHYAADEILLSLMPVEVAAAYERVTERATFWAWA